MSETQPTSPFAPPDPSTAFNQWPLQEELRNPITDAILKPGQGVMFFRSDNLLNEPETEQNMGILGSTILAEVEVAENTFAPSTKLSILGYSVPMDRQKEDFKVHRTYLVNSTPDGNGQQRKQLVDITDRQVKDLNPDELRSLGISAASSQTLDVMSLFGGATIKISNQGNGYLRVVSRARTEQRDASINPVDRPAEWGYTMSAEELLREKALNIGRPQIGRNSRIEGGAFVTSDGTSFIGEIIVVDDKYDGEQFDKLTTKVIDDARRKQGDSEFNTLLSVYNTVKKEFPYSSVKDVDDFLRTIAVNEKGDFPDGTKVPLANFMENKKVICRHLALIGGKILEKIKDQHLIRGEVSIDRNLTWDPTQEGSAGGHAWVRYKDKTGEVWIVDTALGYFGRLKDSKATGAQWNYYRDEDRKAEDARERVRKL